MISFPQGFAALRLGVYLIPAHIASPLSKEPTLATSPYNVRRVAVLRDRRTWKIASLCSVEACRLPSPGKVSYFLCKNSNMAINRNWVRYGTGSQKSSTETLVRSTKKAKISHARLHQHQRSASSLFPGPSIALVRYFAPTTRVMD